MREQGISAVVNERRHGTPSLRMGLWAINQMRGSLESLGAPGGKVAVSDSTFCLLNPVLAPDARHRGSPPCDDLKLSMNNSPLSPLTRPRPRGAPSSWDRRAGRHPPGETPSISGAVPFTSLPESGESGQQDVAPETFARLSAGELSCRLSTTTRQRIGFPLACVYE